MWPTEWLARKVPVGARHLHPVSYLEWRPGSDIAACSGCRARLTEKAVEALEIAFSRDIVWSSTIDVECCRRSRISRPVRRARNGETTPIFYTMSCYISTCCTLFSVGIESLLLSCTRYMFSTTTKPWPLNSRNQLVGSDGLLLAMIHSCMSLL